MAWQSSGTTNQGLVENMAKNGLITDDRVKQAFLQVDRGHYAPSSPYEDSPQPIGHLATISAPHMHAAAIEKLIDYIVPTPSRPAPRVLDIGSGSGYLTHLMAELVGERGLVVGVEHIPALQELGQKNMAKSAEGRALLESTRARFRLGDGRRGWKEEDGQGGTIEKWDAIHVGAAAEVMHVGALTEQLNSPGMIFIPVQDNPFSQYVYTYEKDAKGVMGEPKRLFGVRYVPLTDAPAARR